MLTEITGLLVGGSNSVGEGLPAMLIITDPIMKDGTS